MKSRYFERIGRGANRWPSATGWAPLVNFKVAADWICSQVMSGSFRGVPSSVAD